MGQVKEAIAECKTIDMAKEIRDKAESLQMQNDVAEIKPRAERRIGEFSRELPKAQGNRSDLTSTHDGDKSKVSILAEAGISHPERYEAIAFLPDDIFERMQDLLFWFDKYSKVARIPGKQPIPVMSHGHTGW